MTLRSIYWRDNTVDMLRQFIPGFRFDFRRVRMEAQWEQWYDNDFRTLLPAPTMNNGLSLFSLPDDFIKVPLFKIGGLFYQDAAFSERPVGTTEDAALKAWLEENEERIMQALERATRWWSIKARAVLLCTDDGAVTEIDPSEYFRVGSMEAPDNQVGHIIARRYREQTDEELLSNFDTLTPNRIQVLKFAPEFSPPINTVNTYEYTGSWEEGHIQGEVPYQWPPGSGNVVLGESQAGITGVFTAGQGDGWFEDAREVAARFMIRLTNSDRVLNKRDNSFQYVPLTALTQFIEASPEKTAQQIVNDLRQIINPIIGVSDGESGGFQADPTEYENAQMFAEYLGGFFYLTAGIPPVNWGIDIGPDASGVSIERRQDRAATRVRAYRRDLAGIIPMIMFAAGAPAGTLTYQWITSPFEDKISRNNEIRADVAAGIITVDEARAEKGMDKMPGSNAPQDNQTEGGGSNNDSQ